MQSIVLLIFYSVCRSSLADLTRRPVQLAFKMAMSGLSGLSGDISSYSTRKSAVHTSRTLRTYGWRSKESLGALWLRNNAAEAQKYSVQVESPFSATSIATSTLVTLWDQASEASRIYYGHGAGSRTRLWTVPPFLSKSKRPRGINCCGQSFATERELQRERKEKTERWWSHRCFTSRLAAGKSTWMKEPNTAGQEFIIGSFYFHIKSYLLLL